MIFYLYETVFEWILCECKGDTNHRLMHKKRPRYPFCMTAVIFYSSTGDEFYIVKSTQDFSLIKSTIS